MIKKICLQCNKEIITRAKKYCSRICHSKSQIGKTTSQFQKDTIKRIMRGNNYGFKKEHIPWNKNKICPQISGKNNGFFNKKHTEETKKIMKLKRANQIIPPHSQEHKNKIGLANSISNLGKKQSKETIEKRVNHFKGRNSHFWKGGITKENDKIRTSFEMKLWKKSCMERDNFTCQKTGIRGGKLVVHHINNFADFPELRTSIENGITLSRESHIEFHKIYGKRNNTKEQLLEYLTNY